MRKIEKALSCIFFLSMIGAFIFNIIYCRQDYLIYIEHEPDLELILHIPLISDILFSSSIIALSLAGIVLTFVKERLNLVLNIGLVCIILCFVEPVIYLFILSNLIKKHGFDIDLTSSYLSIIDPLVSIGLCVAATIFKVETKKKQKTILACIGCGMYSILIFQDLVTPFLEEYYEIMNQTMWMISNISQLAVFVIFIVFIAIAGIPKSDEYKDLVRKYKLLEKEEQEFQSDISDPNEQTIYDKEIEQEDHITDSDIIEL